jgi:dTMP kinase
MARGKFITFEGGEGAGKSTQARLLADRLALQGVMARVTREPGGTPFAEQVRDMILSCATAPHGALAETLLFYAARADHLDGVIRPALARGEWVISDRFSDSTRAYQGAAGGVPPTVIDGIERIVVGADGPDLTFLLDLEATAGLNRARGRAPGVADAYEARKLEFHERLRQGFLDLARAEPARVVILDGAQPIAIIAEYVWAEVARRFDMAPGATGAG